MREAGRATPLDHLPPLDAWQNAAWGAWRDLDTCRGWWGDLPGAVPWSACMAWATEHGLSAPADRAALWRLVAHVDDLWRADAARRLDAALTKAKGKR